MTERLTLPEHIAAACPDGPPPGLVPVRLVPVEVFGGDCPCHENRELGEGLHDCHGFSYGLCDAVEAYSDCNRAEGHIFRRDEDESPRSPGEVIVVWVTREEVAKFDRVFGDDAEADAGQSYADMVNAPLSPEAIEALRAQLESGEYARFRRSGRRERED